MSGVRVVWFTLCLWCSAALPVVHATAANAVSASSVSASSIPASSAPASFAPVNSTAISTEPAIRLESANDALTKAPLRAASVAQLPVLIWCLDHLPPRQHYLPGRQPTGPMVEMMQELATRSGFVLQYTSPSPVSRCEHLLATGKADLVTSLLWSAQREKAMVLLPFDEARISIIYRRPDSPALHSEQDFNGHRIVLAQDRPYPKALLNMLQTQGAQLSWGKDLDTALALLLYRQADFFIGPQHYTELARQQNARFAALTTNDWQLDASYAPKSYLGFSRASAHLPLLPTLQQQLQLMVQQHKTHFYH